MVRRNKFFLTWPKSGLELQLLRCNITRPNRFQPDTQTKEIHMYVTPEQIAAANKAGAKTLIGLANTQVAALERRSAPKCAPATRPQRRRGRAQTWYSPRSNRPSPRRTRPTTASTARPSRLPNSRKRTSPPRLQCSRKRRRKPPKFRLKVSAPP